MLTDQARYSLFRRKLLDRIEGIVRESVKPMEKIEGIRILQVDGLNGERRRGQRPQRHRRGHQFGAALPRAGAADRLACSRTSASRAAVSPRCPASSARRATCRASQEADARKGGKAAPAGSSRQRRRTGEPRAERTPRKKD